MSSWLVLMIRISGTLAVKHKSIWTVSVKAAYEGNYCKIAT